MPRTNTTTRSNACRFKEYTPTADDVGKEVGIYRAHKATYGGRPSLVNFTRDAWKRKRIAVFEAVRQYRL